MKWTAMMNPSFTIIETHETESHKATGHAARTQWRNDHPAATRFHDVPTRFVCIDGEGVTLPDGTHVYVLLGAGSAQVSDPAGLPLADCLVFLWSQFLEHGTTAVAYCGFFLSYDFVQWLKSLPEERGRMLLTADGRRKRQPKSASRQLPFPVRWGGWEFDILGSRRFKFRREGFPRWMYICDTGPFFQKSFLSVINPENWSDPVVTAEEYDTIATGKMRRSSAALDSDMLSYNALENLVLSRVLSRLEKGFSSLGVHLRPSQWFGPGQAAQFWLTGRAITCKRLQEVTAAPVLDAARGSYYGGWFEIMAHGLLPGNTYEYDINSAYPHIISQLPCLEHGEWIHNGRTAGFRHVLVRARVRGGDDHIGAMLHRDESGNISRPHDTEGWYWLSELHAAHAALLIDETEVFETWTYHPCSCPPPLAEIADVYQRRRHEGKNTSIGIACKILINSVYGKFAQSVGYPKFGNPLYASLITSGCREMILNAIASHPQRTGAVVMVATDGIYFRTPHLSLPLSGDLGDWEMAEKRNICLFKPGVYWDDKTRMQVQAGDTPVFKARGVSARDFAGSLATVDTQFHWLAARQPDVIDWPEVTFPLSFSMVSAVQALQWGKWELAGTLVPDPKVTQSSNPVMKRCSWHWDGDIIRSRPARNDPYRPSAPYEKRFGTDDPWSQENQEADGITPDGLPSFVWKEALYDHLSM